MITNNIKMSYALHKMGRWYRKHSTPVNIAAFVGTLFLGGLLDRVLLQHPTNQSQGNQRQQPTKWDYSILNFKLSGVEYDTVDVGNTDVWGQPTDGSKYPIYHLTCGKQFAVNQEDSSVQRAFAVQTKKILEKYIGRTIKATVCKEADSQPDKTGKYQVEIFRLWNYHVE